MAPAQADAGPVLDRSGDLPLPRCAQLRGAILDGRAGRHRPAQRGGAM